MIADRWNYLWRISTTSSLTNRHFFAYGIPAPDNILYKTFSERVPQSQGGETQQGYFNLQMEWDVLLPTQAYILRSLIQTVLTAGTDIYLTVDRANGQGFENDFIDIHGKATMPDFDSIPRTKNNAYAGVVWRVNNIAVDNDPSTVL
jgi:hypothetical protein